MDVKSQHERAGRSLGEWANEIIFHLKSFVLFFCLVFLAYQGLLRGRGSSPLLKSATRGQSRSHSWFINWFILIYTRPTSKGVKTIQIVYFSKITVEWKNKTYWTSLLKYKYKSTDCKMYFDGEWNSNMFFKQCIHWEFKKKKKKLRQSHQNWKDQTPPKNLLLKIWPTFIVQTVIDYNFWTEFASF